jgi:hypothetical protein
MMPARVPSPSCAGQPSRPSLVVETGAAWTFTGRAAMIVPALQIEEVLV